MQLLFLLLLFFGCNGHSGPSKTTEITLLSGVPGIAAGIVKNGEMIALEVKGLKKNGTTEQLESSEKFHLGSCTKAMTATLVAIFIDEGKLNWNTTLDEVLTDSELSSGFQKVTIENLLIHRAGLPEGHQVFQQLWSLDSFSGRKLIADTLLKENPIFASGSRFHYSNYNYIVLGHLLEKISGFTFEQLMKIKLFEPLQMYSCGFGATWGHSIQNGILSSVWKDNPAAFGPAGTVHCSISDWGKFLNAHVEGFNGTNNIISVESYKKLHSKHSSNDSDYTYGGWYLLQRKWAHGPVLHHTGSNTYSYANVWIAPLLHSAIMSTANVSGDMAFEATDKAIGTMIQSHLN